MYSIEVQISTGWTLMQSASFESVSLYRGAEEGIIVRDKVDGDITFWDSDYELLLNEKPENTLNAKIYIDNDLLISTTLQLDGEWNERSRYCKLGFVQLDRYTTLLEGISDSFQFNQGIPGVPNISMTVYVENRRQFQTRAVTSTSIPHDPLSNDYWSGCSELGLDAIELYDPNKEYTQYQEFIADPEDGNDAYQCDFDRVSHTYCKVPSATPLLTDYYVCKQDLQGRRPPLVPNISDAYWHFICNSSNIVTNNYRASNVGQDYADLPYDGSLYNSATERWESGGCAGFNQEKNITGTKLYWYLEYLLGQIDNTIEIDFETFCPYVNTIDSQYLNLVYYMQRSDHEGQALNQEHTVSLNDIIDIYKSLFNVDWRLEGQNFVFRHPSEIPKQPVPSYEFPYQYINDIYTKDWSSEQFKTSVDAFIKKERFTIGSSTQFYYATQIIEYENNNTEVVQVINPTLEVDPGHILNKPYTNDSILIFQYEDDLTVPICQYISINDPNTVIWLYNCKMQTYRLIDLFYNYGRPFIKGKQYAEYNRSVFINKEYIRAFVQENNINIPYTRQDLINFDYLIKSTFGDLYVKELSVKLQSASTTINAAKQ